MLTLVCDANTNNNTLDAYCLLIKKTSQISIQIKCSRLIFSEKNEDIQLILPSVGVKYQSAMLS